MTDHAASELAIDRASRKDLARAIAATFREAFMPPFAQLVAILFNNSDPQERTDVLNELAPSVLPSAASRIAGGALARAFASGTEGAISFDQAGWFSPTDVRAIAAHAARHDPLLIDRLGVFYSDRPALVKTLPLATVVAVASHLRSHE
ncbi:MAG: hypothetical protein JO090_06075 [Rhizobacter sp.]|nr:hypothetical protein [Rhizobacter sp.]